MADSPSDKPSVSKDVGGPDRKAPAKSPRRTAKKAKTGGPSRGVGESADRLNSYGEEIGGRLDGTTHLDHLVQACDYIRIEPFYCKFTQRTCFRRFETGARSLAGAASRIVVMDESILTTIHSEIIEQCSVINPRAKHEEGKPIPQIPATFNWRTLERLAKSFRSEAMHRMEHRVANRAVDLIEDFAEVGTKADGEFVANWFLDEWGAVAKTRTPSANLVRQLTIRLGCNILDRARHRPGRKLKSWPVPSGSDEPRQDAVRPEHPAPRSLSGTRVSTGTPSSLAKKRDEIVRKLTGVLVVEIPEFADVQATEIERLKDILDLGIEQARDALSRASETGVSMVSCALVGTANPGAARASVRGSDPGAHPASPPHRGDGESRGGPRCPGGRADGRRRRGAPAGACGADGDTGMRSGKFDPIRMFTPEEVELDHEAGRTLHLHRHGFRRTGRQVDGDVDPPDAEGLEDTEGAFPSTGEDAIFSRRDDLERPAKRFSRYRMYRVPFPRNPSIRLGQALARGTTTGFASTAARRLARWTCVSLHQGAVAIVSST